MKPLPILLLLCSMLILTGCPLLTDSPVDDGSYTGTGWLEGNWYEQKSDGSKGKLYLIKKGSKPGNILVHDVTDGKSDTKVRPVIVSNVGKKIFISAFDEGDEMDERGYYIYQIVKKSNTEFDLIPVKEKSIDSKASSKEIRAYLSEHQNDDIYEVSETERYKRDEG